MLVVLECVESILIVGKQKQCLNDNNNKFIDLFEECGMVTFLQNVQVDAETNNVYMLSIQF